LIVTLKRKLMVSSSCRSCDPTEQVGRATLRKNRISNELTGGSTMAAVSDQLQSLSKLLGLDYEEQDWGIINADGKRLEEFVAVYDSHTLSREMRYQMFELVVASANDALDDELDGVRAGLVIQDFVRRNGEAFPEQVSYWAGLKDSEEFPVADILRNIG